MTGLSFTPACFNADMRPVFPALSSVVYSESAPDCLIWSATEPNSVVPTGMSWLM